MKDTTHDPAAAAEVYYDGACPVCSAEIAQYRRMRGVDAALWRDVAAGAGPPEISPAQALARFHVRRRDGVLISGFRAFVAVWRLNPRLAPAARLLDRPPFSWLGEGCYRLFLVARPLWRRPPS
ncbi:MAG: thiol-disulfide oxidoreductase DCC family protein [Rubrimonas sp.]